ncbi:MAG: acyltransferase [Legionella sp.]|nr:acyltransferase [Legionella sp.]
MMLHSLTSLRFFAAIVVFLSHLGGCLRLHPDNILLTQIFFKLHGVGVLFTRLGIPVLSLFFILTGFVITYSYENKIKMQHITKAQFLFLRFARIYPTYLLTMLLIFPLLLFQFIKELPSELHPFIILIKALTNLTLLHGFIPDHFALLENPNIPSWGLSVDLFFYFTFFHLVSLSKRKFSLLSASLLFFTLTWIILKFNHSTMNETYVKEIYLLLTSPFFRIIDFLTGMSLARLFISMKGKISYPLLFNILEPVAIGLYFLFFYLEVKLKIHIFFAIDLYYLFPMGLIIFVFAFQRGFISKLLQNRLLVFLGHTSFAIFIYHWIILTYASRIIRHFDIQIHTTSAVLATIATVLGSTILVSIINYKYFEQPLYRLARRWCVNFENPRNIRREQSIPLTL